MGLTLHRFRSPKLFLIVVSAFVASNQLLPAAWAQPFTFTAVSSNLPRLSYGSAFFADLDDDGDLDILYTGNSNSARPFEGNSGIAINKLDPLADNRSVPFELYPLTSQTWLGQASWADFDLDGDLDFVLTGTESPEGPYASVAMLYRNDGSGSFAPLDVGLTGVHSGITRWTDFDNDGDSDLLLLGRTSEGIHSVKLYRNDGGDSFTEISTPFAQLAFGDAAWADYDNDGDFDVVISGTGKAGEFITTLYRNDGDDGFVPTADDLQGLAFSALAWGDYDSDGDMDLVLSGAELGIEEAFTGKTILYRNDGGTLTALNKDLYGMFYGSLSWADFDMDGDLDLFAMGRISMKSNHVGYIYQNNDGNFKIVTGLVGASTSTAHWGDFDGDYDVDILVSGLNLSAGPFIKLYRNDSRLVNTPPVAPNGLSAAVNSDNVTLSWNSAFDVQTASSGLTYNVRVGTAPGLSDVMSPMASMDKGHLWVPGFGNVQSNTNWTLQDLPIGVYYWSVQSVDNSYVSSAFSQEGQFSIITGGKFPTDTAEDGILPSELALHPVYPNPFSESATFIIDLPSGTNLRLEIYDVLGKKVRVIADDYHRAGRHRIEWDGRTAAGVPLVAGVYFARLQAGGSLKSRQMVVLK